MTGPFVLALAHQLGILCSALCRGGFREPLQCTGSCNGSGILLRSNGSPTRKQVPLMVYRAGGRGGLWLNSRLTMPFALVRVRIATRRRYMWPAGRAACGHSARARLSTSTRSDLWLRPISAGPSQARCCWAVHRMGLLSLAHTHTPQPNQTFHPKTLCGAWPPAAWQGRQGAEAALVSSGTTVPSDTGKAMPPRLFGSPAGCPRLAVFLNPPSRPPTQCVGTPPTHPQVFLHQKAHTYVHLEVPAGILLQPLRRSVTGLLQLGLAVPWTRELSGSVGFHPRIVPSL